MFKVQQQTTYEQKFNNHKAQAEAFKAQKNYDAALNEYKEAMKQFEAAWIEKKSQDKSLLIMFQPQNLDDKNVTAVKRGVGECYLAKDDLESAYNIFSHINVSHLDNQDAFKLQLSELKKKIATKADVLVDEANRLLSLVGEPRIETRLDRARENQRRALQRGDIDAGVHPMMRSRF